MPEYLVRSPFRVAAALPASLLLPGGIFAVAGGLGTLPASPGEAVLLMALGSGAVALGVLFSRIVWTGRVPARIEEYDLDAEEIAMSRAEARRTGTLVE